MKRMRVGLIAVGATIFVGSAFAAPPRDGGMGPGFPPLGRLVHALELAPEQEQAIEEIVSAAKPRFQALRQNARATRQQLMEANPDDSTYSTDVAAASQASANHAAELVNLSAELKAQVYVLLTAEQKQRATELMQRMQERRSQFMERGPRQHRRWSRRPSDSKDCASGDVDAG